MPKDATGAINKMPLADYFIAISEQRLSRCQYHRGILAGDETGDWCELNNYQCGVAYGSYECEEWNNLKGGDNGRNNAKIQD
uniref:Uncharacterized protein n=1 Tax=viral metagenome TaxID=1070528 RepID=A0A6H2A660_9ZZZZ